MCRLLREGGVPGLTDPYSLDNICKGVLKSQLLMKGRAYFSQLLQLWLSVMKAWSAMGITYL